MKILITGGAGFIGSHLSDLLMQNHEVVVVDNLNPQIHKNDEKLNMKCSKFILSDIISVDNYLEDLLSADIIILLASETGTGQSMYEISKYYHTNIMGMAKLLDSLSSPNRKAKKIILSSSRSVYGEGRYHCQTHGDVFPSSRLWRDMSEGRFEVTCPVCNENVEINLTDEESMLHPSSIYGLTKLNQEQMLTMFCESIKLPFHIFRFQNVYGPGQSLANPYTGILAVFTNLAKVGKDIKVFEDGLESRDFVYVSDLVELVKRSVEEDCDFKILNIGTGEGQSVFKVAGEINTFFGGQSKILVTGSFRMGDIRHNISDNSNLYKIFGKIDWVEFSPGIEKFLIWSEFQEIPDDNYEKSISEMKTRGLLYEQ